MATASFQPEHIPPYTDQASRIWSLVDSPPAKVPIPANVTYETMAFLYVAALSPEVERYHEAAKQPVLMWWMSPWTDEELLAL